MTTALSLNVRGNPEPQPRPRFVRMGAGVRTYTPKAAEAWKRHVRHAAWHEAAMAALPLDAALDLTLLFYLPHPDGWPKWKATMAQAGTVAHTSKPDADNLAKAVMDALTGVLWADDAQVRSLRVEKLYGPPGVFIHATYRTNLLPAQVSRRPKAPEEAASA